MEEDQNRNDSIIVEAWGWLSITNLAQTCTVPIHI